MSKYMSKLFYLSFALVLLLSFNTKVYAVGTEVTGLGHALLGWATVQLISCPQLEDWGVSEKPQYPCQKNTDPNLTQTTGGNYYANSGRGGIEVVQNLNYHLMFNPPANTGIYVADLLQNTPMTSNQAYAQDIGIGFSSLRSILNLWKFFRNISYLLFTLAFMVVGFAIIFRAKLNPQTVINIQLALPRLVVTLLLITFSYAIAGLLIDMMFLSTFVILSTFSVAFKGSTDSFLFKTIFERDILNNLLVQIFGFNFTDGSTVGSAVEGVSGMLAEALGFDAGRNFDLTQLLAAFFSAGIGMIIGLVISVMILVTAFRVLFSLLNSYVKIILLVVTAPIRLLLNAYPGSNAFMEWLKELAAHIAIFPFVILLILITMILSQNKKVDTNFYAETKGTQFPQLTFSNPEAAKSLIALGMLLTMPQLMSQFTQQLSGKRDEGGGLNVMGLVTSAPALATSVRGAGTFAGGIVGGGAGMAGQGLRGLYRNTIGRNSENARPKQESGYGTPPGGAKQQKNINDITKGNSQKTTNLSDLPVNPVDQLKTNYSNPVRQQTTSSPNLTRKPSTQLNQPTTPITSSSEKTQQQQDNKPKLVTKIGANELNELSSFKRPDKK